jgi:hypothetical protein
MNSSRLTNLEIRIELAARLDRKSRLFGHFLDSFCANWTAIKTNMAAGGES